MVSKKLAAVTIIVYTVFLITVSLITIGDVPNLGSGFDDKIYHFIAYFILAFLWVTYFKFQKKNVALVSVCIIVFGIVLELIQHKINPNRAYEIYDLLANCLGVVIGALFAYKVTILSIKQN